MPMIVVVEVDDGPVHERLEPADLEALDLHAGILAADVMRFGRCQEDIAGGADTAVDARASRVARSFPPADLEARMMAIGRT